MSLISREEVSKTNVRRNENGNSEQRRNQENRNQARRNQQQSWIRMFLDRPLGDQFLYLGIVLVLFVFGALSWTIVLLVFAAAYWQHTSVTDADEFDHLLRQWMELPVADHDKHFLHMDSTFIVLFHQMLELFHVRELEESVRSTNLLLELEYRAQEGVTDARGICEWSLSVAREARMHFHAIILDKTEFDPMYEMWLQSFRWFSHRVHHHVVTIHRLCNIKYEQVQPFDHASFAL